MFKNDIKLRKSKKKKKNSLNHPKIFTYFLNSLPKKKKKKKKKKKFIKSSKNFYIFFKQFTKKKNISIFFLLNIQCNISKKDKKNHRIIHSKSKLFFSLIIS